MVYVIDDAVVLSGSLSEIRATRFWRAGGTVSVRFPGLTVVKACDQQTPTNASGG